MTAAGCPAAGCCRRRTCRVGDLRQLPEGSEGGHRASVHHRWHNLVGAHLVLAVTATDYEATTGSPGKADLLGTLGAMSSVVLAACHPDRFTIVDSRTLKALRGLGLLPRGHRSSGSATG